jgi:hypothetical protein
METDRGIEPDQQALFCNCPSAEGLSPFSRL